ncbi:MAG: hypothetical protein HRT40_07560 [Campylobacteraceae bacterium]|nr:hypothetical protein [Campylobacteraceae bacterium]
MQTIILLSLLFLLAVFSSLLYLKNKNSRVDKLNKGECPECHEKTKTFFDEKTRTTFTMEVISAKLLKNHGCTGINEIEYVCKNCGLKEVYTQ